MTPTATRIYEALHGRGYVRTEDLARELGFADARSLRGDSGDHGILREAGDEIFREKGLVLVRSMRDPSGLKLTNDAEEIRKVRAQWLKIVTSIAEQCKDYEAKANMLESRQVGLEI